MDVSRVPEVGSRFATTLREAGISTAEDLANVEDLATLSERTGVDEDRLGSFRDAARAHLERVLSDAGVLDPASLAEADMATISAQTGIDEAYLARYQSSARDYIAAALSREGLSEPSSLATAEDLAGVAERTGIQLAALVRLRDGARERAATPAQPDRVLLVEGAALARVRVAGVEVRDVALVTPGPSDAVDEDVLVRAGGDAVLLREGADVVPALVGGVTHRGLPLYKERRRGEGDAEEVRIRVREIREVRESKGMLGRFFGRR